MSYVKKYISCYLIIMILLTICILIFMESVSQVYADYFFLDDFEDGDTYGWTVTEGSTSYWSVVTDGTNKLYKCNNSANTHKTTCTGDSEWANYSVSAAIKSDSDSGYPALIFRYQDVNNLYMAQLRYSENRLRLYKKRDGIYSLICADAICNLDSAAVYNVKVDVNGSSIKININDSLKIDTTDTSFSTGMVGLRSYGGVQYFDDISVKSIKPTIAPMAEPAGIADFYVASIGSDSNSGTQTSPFRTIQKAVDAVRTAKNSNPNKNYLVFIRGGGYPLTVPVTLGSLDSGSDNYSITYAAYPGEDVTIYGGKILSGTWIQGANNIWSITVPSGIAFNQLFVNRTRATRSRQPNTGSYYTVNSVNADYMSLTVNQDIPTSYDNISGTQLNSMAYWHYNRQRVNFIRGFDDTIACINQIGAEGSSFKISSGCRVWLENAFEFIDQPGEWYLNTSQNKLYYMVTAGENPNNMAFVYPQISTLFEVRGSSDSPVKNVNFHGLNFRYTEWTLPSIDRKGFQAGHFGNTSTNPIYTPPGAIIFEYVEKSRIQSCGFYNLGEGAIALERGCHSNLIERNTMSDVGAIGIQIGRKPSYTGTGHPLHSDFDIESDSPESNVISNNNLQNMGTTDLGSVAIFNGYAHYTKINHNLIANCPYTGINDGWRWGSGTTNNHNNIIEWNNISYCMKEIFDGGGIYGPGEKPGSKWINNYIHDNYNNTYGSYDIDGIYGDQGTANIEIAYNYITNIQNNRIHFYLPGAGINEHDNYNTVPLNLSLYGPQ